MTEVVETKSDLFVEIHIEEKKVFIIDYNCLVSSLKKNEIINGCSIFIFNTFHFRYTRPHLKYNDGHNY